jgi:hypothetical protein
MIIEISGSWEIALEHRSVMLKDAALFASFSIYFFHIAAAAVRAAAAVAKLPTRCAMEDTCACGGSEIAQRGFQTMAATMGSV